MLDRDGILFKSVHFRSILGYAFPHHVCVSAYNVTITSIT